MTAYLRHLLAGMPKILIADDDARMRQMLRQIVAAIASAVCEARDGAEASLLYAAERPDWVLMDLRMKPVDGLRATAEIKASFPDARIVIVSDYDDEKVRAKAARVGACAYVLKENLHELVGLITGVGMEAIADQANKAQHSRFPNQSCSQNSKRPES